MEEKRKGGSRNWNGVLNNPTLTLEELHTAAEATYTCGQKERGKEGTPHLQFYMNFAKQQRLATMKKKNAEAHWTEVRIDNGCHQYAMKEETRIDGPWEYGTKPVQRNNKTDWAEVKLKAKTNRIEEIPDDIYVKYYSTLKRIAKDHLHYQDKEALRGIWISGPAGCGKSRAVKKFSPTAFPKNRTPWWDGYNGEEVVVMDDVDKYDVKLGGLLKDWGDRYAKTLEVKGGVVTDNWKHFIVTSNYTIGEIWDDSSTQEALYRRYIQVKFLSNGEIQVTPRTRDTQDGYKELIIEDILNIN